jgi:hypothetical protein
MEICLVSVPPKILINSLPKAGTNMLSKLLDLAGLRWNHVCLDSRLILRATPWVRLWRKVSQYNGEEVMVGIGAPVSVPRRLIERYFERLAPNNYIKAHVGYTTGIVRLTEKHGIVPLIIIRDPRDVIVSQIHYVLNTPKHFLHRTFAELGDRERCFDAAIDGGLFGGTFLENIRARCLSLDVWLQSPRSIVVRYEDLVGSQGGGSEEAQRETVAKLFRNAGIIKSDEEVRSIAAELYGPGKRTFRKGRIGEGGTELTPAQLARIDDMLGDLYARWGYAGSSRPQAGLGKAKSP